MYIIKLKNGLKSAKVNVNGSTIEVYEGQVISELLAKKIPDIVEEVGTKETELIVDVSDNIDVQIEDSEVLDSEETKEEI